MPLYEYEHDCSGSGECGGRFEVLHGANDPPLTHCPRCGKPCHRAISAFSTISTTKSLLGAANLERHGFTQYKKAGDRFYEKSAGEGPRTIRGA